MACFLCVTDWLMAVWVATLKRLACFMNKANELLETRMLLVHLNSIQGARFSGGEKSGGENLGGENFSTPRFWRTVLAKSAVTKEKSKAEGRLSTLRVVLTQGKGVMRVQFLQVHTVPCMASGAQITDCRNTGAQGG